MSALELPLEPHALLSCPPADMVSPALPLDSLEPALLDQKSVILAIPPVETLEPHAKVANVPTSTLLPKAEPVPPTKIASLQQFALETNVLLHLETADQPIVVNSKDANALATTREPFVLISTTSAALNGLLMQLA